MMKALVASIATLFTTALLVATGCRESPTVVCPAILYLKATVPDTTTIKVGASATAVAGSAYGGCDRGPPPADFVWKISDSAIVSVVSLDSIHARIQGLRPGTATVTPVYRSGAVGPDGVRVGVVP
jgi:hypothetical protein